MFEELSNCESNLDIVAFQVKFFLFFGGFQQKIDHAEETVQLELWTEAEHNTTNIQAALNFLLIILRLS